MGAWSFVKGRLYDRFGADHKIRRISRYESGSPATGSHGVHVQEQAERLTAIRNSFDPDEPDIKALLAELAKL